jgi:hypothetical protein
MVIMDHGQGSIIAQLAGERDLIDEYQLVVVPIVLGAGRTMFDGLGRAVRLELTSSRTLRNGKVYLRYQPRRSLRRKRVGSEVLETLHCHWHPPVVVSHEDAAPKRAEAVPVQPDAEVGRELLPVLGIQGSSEPLCYPPAVRSKADLAVLGGFAVLWLAMSLAIDPVGEFPLNDDWGWAVPIFYQMTFGAPTLVYAQSMTLVAQLVWGWLFCLPAGFSFTALRISTLTAGFVAIALTYAIGRELGLRRTHAVLAALAVAVNPLFVLHANTFMTEVPFGTATLGSLWLLLRAWRTGSRGALVGGLLAAIAATFIRQTGLLIPVVFTAIVGAQQGFRSRAARYGLAAILIDAVALGTFEQWLALSGRMPGLYHLKTESLKEGLGRLLALDGAYLFQIVTRIAASFGYFALWLAPLVLVLVAPRISRRVAHVIVWIAAAAATAALARAGGLMPWLGNTIYDFGLGLRPYPEEYPRAPVAVWLGVTWIALVSLGYLLVTAYAAYGERRKRAESEAPSRAAMLLLALLVVLPLVPLILMSREQYFDRYLTPLVPLAALVLCALVARRDLRQEPQAIAWSAGGLCALAFLVFAVAATHDGLRLQESRWSLLLDFERSSGVDPSYIDGGHEYNSWRFYVRDTPKGPHWLDANYDYEVRTVVAPGDGILAERPAATWMSLSPDHYYLVKKRD